MFHRSRVTLYYIPVLLTLALGFVNIVSAVTAPQPERIRLLHTLVSGHVSIASRGLVLVLGFFLLLL